MRVYVETRIRGRGKEWKLYLPSPAYSDIRLSEAREAKGETDQKANNKLTLHIHTLLLPKRVTEILNFGSQTTLHILSREDLMSGGRSGGGRTWGESVRFSSGG